ncbi:MAG: YceH family protein [SAR324 cluster bacterium]|nr:YceH family protein [SAR324 cluster bacterium]
MVEENENQILQLSAVECRVLGCLIEKEITTPDYYPLSLNSLTNACNQKSSRNPVVEYAESTVEAAAQSLQSKRLVIEFRKGGKVAKFEQHIANVLPQLERAEYSVIAELLLRGPQTLGELKGRASRMHPFNSLDEVSSTLQWLIEHDPPLALKLPRQPGFKESRYFHCFAPEPPDPLPAPGGTEENDRFLKLETEIEDLKKELDALKQEFSEFKAQFE